jgi:hypothetical protein
MGRFLDQSVSAEQPDQPGNAARSAKQNMPHKQTTVTDKEEIRDYTSKLE